MRSINASVRERPQALFGALSLLIPFGFAVFLLSTFPSGSDSNFFSILAFFAIGMSSLAFIILTMKYNTEIHWKDSPERSDFVYLFALPLPWIKSKRTGNKIYLPFGFIAVLGIGLLLPRFFDTVGILIALAIGGLVLGYQQQRSKSFFLPWITHSAYNGLAVILSTFSIMPMSASYIYVPDFSNFVADRLPSANIATQLSMHLGMQFIVVAFAEELLKVSMAIGAALLFKLQAKVAITFAVLLWTILHMILSYRLNL